MPRAEVGSTKHIANQMKAKGLQRLRWYCQACQRQMRDENGFKCHVASESHVRNMQTIGEDPRKAINEFSREFERDFLTLLRTGHGEKKVNLNQFYQEYIGNKEHMHMNATKWTSLSEFAKHLGRNGIVRVEEDEKKTEQGVVGASGLTISWIDNSPESLKRQEAIKKRERMEKGDEEREQRLIREQIKRAKRDIDAEADDLANDEDDDPTTVEGFKRNNGEKVVLAFGSKKHPESEKPPSPPLTDKDDNSDMSKKIVSVVRMEVTSQPAEVKVAPSIAAKPGFSFGSSTKPKNIFAAASKKNALTGAKKPINGLSSQKPMSEAERIMKEELERKKHREAGSGNAFKRQRVS